MRSVGLALAVSALVAIAPSVGAVSANTTLLKPFKTLSASVSSSINSGACGKAKIDKVSSWALRTGTFHAAGHAKAPSCATSASINSAEWTGQVALSMPMTFSTAGNHSIVATWKITQAEMWNQTPFTGCKLNYAASFSTCASDAESDTLVESIFYDSTNFSIFVFSSSYFANYSYNQNYSFCSGSPCTPFSANVSGGSNGAFSGSVVVTNTVNLSGTNAIVYTSHNYFWEVIIFTYTYAAAYTENAKGVGHASAIASTNMATLGNGAVLGSVAIS